MVRNEPAPIPDAVRDERPADPAWRADALRPSPHRRLADEIAEPRAATRREAEEVCRRITRTVLRDFAPALVLLRPSDRERLRALTAWTVTLFDLANQQGLAGERLAAVNRWEFELEQALEGRPTPQPVFLELAREARRVPWDTADFERLTALARECAVGEQPATADAAAAASRRLAVALVQCFVATPGPALLQLAEGLIRVRQLQDLHLALHHGSPVPATAGESWRAQRQPPREELETAVLRECERTRSLLMGGARGVGEMPEELRAAALWLVYAGLALVTDVEDDPHAAAERAPRLAAMRRIGLLLRARWTARTLRRRRPT